MTRKTRCIDNSLLWNDSIESSFWYTVDYINHCATNGIVLNPDKFHFAKMKVEFAGFLITANDVKPTKKDDRSYPSLLHTQEYYRCQVLVWTCESHAFLQAKVIAPRRELLCTKNQKFYWDEMLECLFRELKWVIVQRIEKGVKMFKINKITCLATDYYKTGVSYFLFQKHCNCPGEVSLNCGDDHWKLFLVGSCFTNDVESCDMPVEGKALALIFRLESCRMFVLGSSDLLVTVDHQSLTRIFFDQAQENIKKNLVCLIEKKYTNVQITD